MEIPIRNNESGKHLFDDRHGLLYTSNDIAISNIDDTGIHAFILNHMTEGIFVVQEEYVRYANESIANIYGIPLEKIIGSKAHNYVHPEDQERLIEIYERRWSGEFTRAIYEFRLIDGQGSIKWVLAESFSIEWEGRPAVLQSLIDITARKNKEQELQKAYDIISHSSSVMFVWENSEGWPVEYVTSNAETIFGYTAEEFRNGVISYAELIHPDDITLVGEEVQKYSCDKNVSRFKHEPYRILTRTGEIKWIEDKTEIIRSTEGTITHYQGIVQDITEQKMAEDEKERLITQLQSAIAQIKTLQGLIPICSYCKKIRNDDGYWNQIEEYIAEHSDAHFSHSICPTCVEKYHPEIKDEIEIKKER